MKRQLTALILMLAMGMQSSLVAFAGVQPLMQSDCQTSTDSVAAPHNSCCPDSGVHPAGCCLDACLAVGAVARTNFRCAALKPHRLKMPPHNCETRQGSILSFPNNHYKERRFLPGLRAGVATPNI